MKPHFFKLLLYYLFPFFWALLFVLWGFIPERLFRYFHQSLPLVLVVIFYFALFSFKRLNVFLIFLLGILSDLISVGAFGLNTFIFVWFFFWTNFLKNYIQKLSFNYLWGIFSLLMLLTDVIWAWLGRIAVGVWVSPSFWFVQYIFVCLCYPFIFWITAKLNRCTKDI